MWANTGMAAPRSAQDVDLSGGVVGVVIAANYMGNAQIDVVHHHGQVVGRRAIRTGDDQVVQFVVVDHHLAAHHIVENHRSVQRILEANDGGFAGRWAAAEIAAAAVVTRFAAGGQLRAARGFEFFPAAKTIIGVVFGEQLPDRRGVTIHPFTLVEGPAIPVEAQPRHRFEDDVGGRAGGSLLVGVLDSEHQLAAGLLRVQPVEQGGAGAANMEGASRAWWESGYGLHDCRRMIGAGGVVG